MPIRVIKGPIKREELLDIASEEFGDIVKAVVDVEHEIMAVGGELHADEEVLLSEEEGSKREHAWGINLYPKKFGEEWIEFDSLVNIKPSFGNRSRGVDNQATQAKIKEIVRRLIID